MKTKRKEIAFIVFNRLFWLFVFLATIIGPPTFLFAYRNAKIEMVDSSASIEDYDEYLNQTTVNVEVTFDKNVNSADIEVIFYDNKGLKLETIEHTFLGYGKTASSTFYYVDGKVESYEISEIYSVTRYGDIVLICTILICVIGGITSFALFVASLFLSCKKYRYNGNDILVYAGWYKHYIKVNGEKFDEHNTGSSRTALYMSCTLDDGAEVLVRISTTNSITLKINGKLQKPL